MKITRENLLASDYDTLFTKDPGTFIEAIIINLLWANKTESEAIIIERQRYVFEKWLKYYTTNLRLELLNEVGAGNKNQALGYEDGYIAGQVHALNNLPMKKSLLTKYVDLIEVSNLLRLLKTKLKVPSDQSI